MIREKQPKMFEYLFKMRDKKEVQKLINLENKQPVVYTSGRYDEKHDKTTIVVPITSSRNGNVLVFDLRYNLDELLSEEEPRFHPIVKELCFNKCPAVAPLSVLSKENWEKLGLTKEQIDKNLASVMAHPEFAEKMRTENEEKTFEPAEEPEQALYDGFLNDTDRIKIAAVRNADVKKLADFHPDFIDERLPELLLHYKGRNYPESLSEKETEEWEKYRRNRLEKYLPKFLEELNGIYEQDDFIAEELKLYLENIL
jgi:exodeoxyribonuclease-1